MGFCFMSEVIYSKYQEVSESSMSPRVVPELARGTLTGRDP